MFFIQSGRGPNNITICFNSWWNFFHKYRSKPIQLIILWAWFVLIKHIYQRGEIGWCTLKKGIAMCLCLHMIRKLGHDKKIITKKMGKPA